MHSAPFAPRHLKSPIPSISAWHVATEHCHAPQAFRSACSTASRQSAPIHLISKCLAGAGAGADARQLDVGELLLWSRFVDSPTHEAIQEMAHASGVQNIARNATHLLLLAVVHDYLSRGLSPKRLLDEIPSQKNESYLRAVEQSFRDIETLGETQITSAKTIPNHGSKNRSSLHRFLALRLVCSSSSGLVCG